MGVGSFRDFADTLQKTPLLTPAQQAQIGRELNGCPPDVRSLARRILGWQRLFRPGRTGLSAGLPEGPKFRSVTVAYASH